MGGGGGKKTMDLQERLMWVICPHPSKDSVVLTLAARGWAFVE